MRLARCKRDFHIGYRWACQYADVRLFIKMCKYQPLPVFIKQILFAVGFEYNSAVFFKRLQYKMNFGVMPERLKMTDSLNCIGNGFFVNYIACVEFCVNIETLFDKRLQNLKLNITHRLDLGVTSSRSFSVVNFSPE